MRVRMRDVVADVFSDPHQWVVDAEMCCEFAWKLALAVDDIMSGAVNSVSLAVSTFAQ